MKVVFWGVGNVAQRFMRRHQAFMQAVEVVGFTDSEKNKWYSRFEADVCCVRGGV